MLTFHSIRVVGTLQPIFKKNCACLFAVDRVTFLLILRYFICFRLECIAR